MGKKKNIFTAIDLALADDNNKMNRNRSWRKRRTMREHFRKNRARLVVPVKRQFLFGPGHVISWG